MLCCGTRVVGAREGVKEAWLDPLKLPSQAPRKDCLRKEHSCMLPRCVSFTYRVFGMHPCTIDTTTQRYMMRWCSPSAIHCVLLLLWLSILLITSSVGMARLFSSNFHKGSGANEMELLAVLIIVGCIFNAWVNVFARLVQWRSFCTFFNGWMEIYSTTDLNPFKSIDIVLFSYIAALLVFLGAVVAMAMSTSSDLLLGTVELLAHVLLLAEEKFKDEDSWKMQVRGK